MRASMPQMITAPTISAANDQHQRQFERARKPRERCGLELDASAVDWLSQA